MDDRGNYPIVTTPEYREGWERIWGDKQRRDAARELTREAEEMDADEDAPR